MIKAPYNFRYTIEGLKSDDDLQGVAGLLRSVSGVLKVDFDSGKQTRYVFLGMDLRIDINDLNEAINPEFSLSEEKDLGSLMSFFP